jgi:hypothetical protein
MARTRPDLWKLVDPDHDRTTSSLSREPRWHFPFVIESGVTYRLVKACAGSRGSVQRMLRDGVDSGGTGVLIVLRDGEPVVVYRFSRDENGKGKGDTGETPLDEALISALRRGRAKEDAENKQRQLVRVRQGSTRIKAERRDLARLELIARLLAGERLGARTIVRQMWKWEISFRSPRGAVRMLELLEELLPKTSEVRDRVHACRSNAWPLPAYRRTPRPWETWTLTDGRLLAIPRGDLDELKRVLQRAARRRKR